MKAAPAHSCSCRIRETAEILRTETRLSESLKKSVENIFSFLTSGPLLVDYFNYQSINHYSVSDMSVVEYE